MTKETIMNHSSHRLVHVLTALVVAAVTAGLAGCAAETDDVGATIDHSEALTADAKPRLCSIYTLKSGGQISIKPTTREVRSTQECLKILSQTAKDGGKSGAGVDGVYNATLYGFNTNNANPQGSVCLFYSARANPRGTIVSEPFGPAPFCTL